MQLVGDQRPEAYDNPTGALVLPHIERKEYEVVFDFGCGCGRVARQLIQQSPRPRRYLGIDVHAGAIDWCKRNLTPSAPTFQFEHHDVFHAVLNPGADKPTGGSFPIRDGSTSLIVAWSIFTHLAESSIAFYLSECARTLRTDGVLWSTWFLFDRRYFPMLGSAQNALYGSEADPTAVVIYSREWLEHVAREAGLTITGAYPPGLRGYQWTLLLRPSGKNVRAAAWPADDAPFGRVAIPDMPADAARIGLEPERA